MYDIFIVGGFERLVTKVKEQDESNYRIGFTTTPFEMCFFFILQFSHSDRKSSDTIS
jgi:hypothetical protein